MLGNYQSKPITQLLPGTQVLPTDIYAAVDTTDNTQSPVGSTKKYTIAQLQSFIGIGLPWTTVVDPNYLMSPNNGYVANTAAPTLCTLILPTIIEENAQINITGQGTGLFQIMQNLGQQILFNNQVTTVGPSGYLLSTLPTDSVYLLCIEANTTFKVILSSGWFSCQ